MKYCSCCKKLLNLSEFSERTDKKHYSIDDPKRYKSRCFACDSLLVKLKFFNISLEEFNELREKQEDRCAVCGKHESDSRNQKTKHFGLYIDHCHKTGKVRGLLCHNCNLLIGHSKDNVDNLLAAIRYLDIMI